MSSINRSFSIFIKVKLILLLAFTILILTTANSYAQKSNDNKANYSYTKPVKKRTTALQARATSLTVDLPFTMMQSQEEYVQTLGFWHMLTDRLNLGMNFGLSLDQADVITREAIGGEAEERTQQTQTEFIFSPGFTSPIVSLGLNTPRPFILVTSSTISTKKTLPPSSSSATQFLELIKSPRSRFDLTTTSHS